MIKNIILFLSFLAIISCSQEEEIKTGIAITSTNIEDVSVQLSIPGNDSVYAQTSLVNGEGQLDFTLDYPQMVEIKIEGVQQPLNFFADKTAMTLNIDGATTPPSFEVTGSKYQDSLMAFGEAEQSLNRFLNSFRGAWQQADQANDSLTMFVIRTKVDSAYNSFNNYTIDFAAKNGILGAMIIQRFIYIPEYADMQKVYDNIRVEYRNSPDVKSFKERLDILKNTQVGMRFTDITQNDTTGQPFSISNIKAKYILIDFWASWCGPCRQANPELVKIYEEFHPKGFEIVGVSLDRKLEDWKKGINEDNLPWPQMSDLNGWENGGSAAYAIRSIPQSIIIDDQGFIVNKNLEPSVLRAFLNDKL